MASKSPLCFSGPDLTAQSLKDSESTSHACCCHAISENPRNASLTIPSSTGVSELPNGRGPLKGGGDVKVGGDLNLGGELATSTSKFWSAGRELKISFLSGTEWQKQQVKKIAPLYCEIANISFTFVDSAESDILIEFNPAVASWSHIGTDCSYFAKKRAPTMNLGWIDQSKSENEIRQVILHQFGHALGANHQYERPLCSIQWNKEKVYEDFGKGPLKWTKEKIEQNLFKLHNCQEDTSIFDGQSIMLYYYPSFWTLNKKGTPCNTTFSEKDKSYFSFLYPHKELDAGQFNTMEIRPWDKPRVQNQVEKQFNNKWSYPPRVPVGLTWVDFECKKNIRIKATATNITKTGFTAGLNAWSDTILYSAGLTYLEVCSQFEYLQTGTFSTTEVGKWEDHAPKNSKRITFAKPFCGQPPKVICWLNALDMDSKYNWRVKAYITDIDTTGFTAHIDTWSNSILYLGGLTWIAHPGDQSKVSSGSFNTQDVRAWNKPSHNTSNTLSFGKCFTKAPKVIMAVNQLDYDRKKNLRLKLSTSSVTQEGFTWHLQSWFDSIHYMSGASYFAWE